MAKKKTETAPEPPGSDTHISLDKLHLDGSNPRLGAQAGQSKSEIEILNKIVDLFGVDDVLSSLAVNGYFEAEPMVGVRIQGKNDEFRIAEGNRRLAACLILAGDKRAKNHEKRTKEYQELQEKHKQKPITQVPVRILSNDKNLMSYLGVRHIAASQPWDSYAKAAWVAKVIDENDLSLDDVTEMIGDQHNTIARTLEGYYFVNQLIQADQFVPSDSLRSGRGSNPAYPFSWVYTALGYNSVRDWLALSDLAGATPPKHPLKKKHLNEAAEFMTFLFGNTRQGRNAAIAESRQIGSLALAVADPQSRRLLKRGETVKEVTKLLKPAKEQVSESLLDAQEALKNALTPLLQGDVLSGEATDLVSSSKKVRSLAANVHNKITEIARSDEVE